MSKQADHERLGEFSGKGLVMGAAIGVIFVPLAGPFSIVIGAGLGLLVGAAIHSGQKPDPAPRDAE